MLHKNHDVSNKPKIQHTETNLGLRGQESYLLLLLTSDSTWQTCVGFNLDKQGAARVSPGFSSQGTDPPKATSLFPPSSLNIWEVLRLQRGILIDD